MTQSREIGSNIKHMPQNIPPIYLQKSAATTKAKEAPELIAGYTRYQMYSNDNYIYSVSSSFEWLYRVSYHREKDTYIKDGEIVFRRISETDPRLRELRKIHPTRIEGHPERYKGKKYYLYTLRHVSPHVYVIAPASDIPLKSPLDDVSARMYFIFESKER